MKPGMRAFFKDAATTAALLTVAFGICLLLRNILVLREEAATVFVLAVFLVSLLTEGYLFGIAASVLSVLAVNFAFTPPYFSFNFAITDNLVSAVFMIAISHSTCSMAIDVNAKCIVVNSLTGMTARMVSRFRCPAIILGATTSERAWRQLNLSWGVIPVLCEQYPSLDIVFYQAEKQAKQLLSLKPGDNIVMTGGQIGGAIGNTNTIKVEVIK